MKKILIASILLNIYCFLNAQFIPESSDLLEYKSSKYFEGDRKDTTFILDVGSDTLVNNQLCKKMFSSFFHCKKPFDESYIYEMDSIVYFATKGSFSFETLYDFTKKKNEQWRINISDDYYIIVQVDSVYQKRIGSMVYKVLGVTYFHFEKVYQTEKFRIANEYCSIIIEKFGDIYYYFNLVSRESDCLGLYVSKGLSKYIYPNLDTLNLENFDRSCKPSVITAINGEVKWMNLQLHPTISSNQITVTGIESTPITHYSIVSVTGFITQEKFTSPNINVSNLINGMYLLNLYNEQGLLQTLKFVKE